MRVSDFKETLIPFKTKYKEIIMTNEQLQHYFDRVGLPFLKTASIENLERMQFAHLHTFPFENLNPFLSIPVMLDNETLFHKFVLDKRGGYCFEQNLFFMNILQSLGYEVRGLLGNVFDKDNFVNRRTHMLLLVLLNNQEYVVDVGFGSVVSDYPLKFELGVVQKAEQASYKIEKSEENAFVLQIRRGENWKNLYRFDLCRYSFEDFEVGNWFTSTQPEADFMDSIQLSFKSESCRYTLHNNRFTTYYNEGHKETKYLQSASEVRHCIEHNFNIKLNNLPGLDKKLNKIIEKA